MRIRPWIRLAASLTVSLLVLQASPARAALPKVISVCDDGAEWPPYTYYKRSYGVKTDQLIGYSVDYLQRVLERKGMHFKLELIPWVRCMEAVDHGDYDMLLNAANNPERDRTYWVTKPYYALTPVYFYDQDRSKPKVAKAEDLKKLRLCGVHGYSYVSFRLKPTEIDTGANDIARAFLKLKSNRCDAVPERLEIAVGYRALDVVDYTRMNIGYEPVPWLKSVPFSMMVSRHIPYAKELLDLLNEGITEINAHNGARDLAARYMIPGVVPGM